MRAAFSILGLVITLAVVLFMVKQQARSLQPPAAAASAGVSASAAGALQAGSVRPEAVRQELQQLVDQAAARASEAQP